MFTGKMLCFQEKCYVYRKNVKFTGKNLKFTEKWKKKNLKLQKKWKEKNLKFTEKMEFLQKKNCSR